MRGSRCKFNPFVFVQVNTLTGFLQINTRQELQPQTIKMATFIAPRSLVQSPPYLLNAVALQFEKGCSSPVNAFIRFFALRRRAVDLLYKPRRVFFYKYSGVNRLCSQTLTAASDAGSVLPENR